MSLAIDVPTPLGFRVVCTAARWEIISKTKQGRIIGFEKLNVLLAPGALGISVEVLSTFGGAA